MTVGLTSGQGNSQCPVCVTAEIMCSKWTMLLIRDLVGTRCRFGELERSLDGISPRTLSLRLRELEEHGIIARTSFPEIPPRVEYCLTDKGRDLVPLVDAMREYGKKWLVGDGLESTDDSGSVQLQPTPVA